MKSLMAAVIILGSTVAAGAIPAPVGDLGRVENQAPALDRKGADSDIDSVARERSYFQAPQPQFNSGNVSCRLQLNVFDKTRIAQACN